MPQCPICQTEYTESTLNFCSTCGWDLTPDSFPEQVLEVISHKERVRVTWARAMWSWTSEMRAQLQQQNLIQSQLSQILEQTNTERLLEIFAAVSPSAKQLIELKAELQQAQQKISQFEAQLYKAQSQIGTDGLDVLIQAMKTDESETVQRVALLLLKRSAAPKAVEALEEFQPDSYKLLSSLPYGPHKDVVMSVAISPDGRTLASGSGEQDKTIKLWNVNTGELITTLEGHQRWVSSVTFSPDGQILASGSGDTTIRLWNLATGAQTSHLAGHTEPVLSVAISPDAETLVSSSQDKTIRIWSLPTGELLHTISNSHPVNSVAISADGRFIVSGNNDGKIEIWHLDSGQLIHAISAHNKLIRSVAISRDGWTIASGTDNKNIKIWCISP